GGTTPQGTTTTIQIGNVGASATTSHLEAPAQSVALGGSDIEAGAAMAASSPMGLAGATGPSLEAPPEVLRAAAAIGALSPGPAPMLTAVAQGMAPGEPVPFTAVGLEPAVMAAIGAPDQAAGASPGMERLAPVEIIGQSEGD